MNFPYGAPVLPKKLETLKKRLIELQINLKEIEEKFVRGGGKGGQKINKTANAVVLSYQDLVIKVQWERQRELNRFLALRELADRIERRRYLAGRG